MLGLALRVAVNEVHIGGDAILVLPADDRAVEVNEQRAVGGRLLGELRRQFCGKSVGTKN